MTPNPTDPSRGSDSEDPWSAPDSDDGDHDGDGNGDGNGDGDDNATGDRDGTGATADELLVNELFVRLEATAELPIDPATNRWLGEAEAVARDAATSDLDDETIEKRVRQVAHLLGEADDPDHEEARAHLEAARELCRELLEGECSE